MTEPSVAELVEAADLVLDVGPLKVRFPSIIIIKPHPDAIRMFLFFFFKSDFNTGSFSYGIKCENTVELRIDRTVVGYAGMSNVHTLKF